MLSSLTLRPFLTLAHWLAGSLLLASLYSGINIALDQRPWLMLVLPYWPAIGAPALWHQVAALVWLVLVGVYLLHRRAQKPPPHSEKMRPHQQSVRGLRWAFLLLAGSGSILFLNWLPAWAWYVRGLHFIAATLFLLCSLWHILTQWKLGRWPRMRLALILPVAKWRVLALSCSVLLLVLLPAAWSLQRWQEGQTLPVARISGEMRIDGVADEAQWRSASSITLATYYGAPYQRSVPVTIKMLHDGYTLYAHAQWPDPEPSLNHLPLVKTAQGWRIRQTRLLQNDEQTFYEDKFAVMLGAGPWDALKSVFLAGVNSHPAQRGGHQMPQGQMVDIWHWKAVRNHQFGNLDDAFFGPTLPRLPGQRRYTWGYGSDPLHAGGYKENWAWVGDGIVKPLRLPRQPGDLQRFQPAASHRNPVLALDWHDSQPYRAEQDHYPEGTILPGVVWIHPNEGDRADVRANGIWKDGYWHLEMARALGTANSLAGAGQFDQTIRNGIFLWFATFDHAQVRHTYHVRPLRLELAP